MVVDTEAGRILIVDDNKEHREALGRVLTQDGYHVVGLASSGEEALSLLSGGQVELVISDMWMPRMGRLEFLRHVKRCRPTTQVIILTAYGDYVSHPEAVMPASRTLVVESRLGGKLWVLGVEVPKDLAITAGGKTKRLEDLKEGERFSLRWIREKDRLVAESIEVIGAKAP